MSFLFGKTREQRLKDACEYFKNNEIYIAVRYMDNNNKFEKRGLVTEYTDDNFVIQESTVPYKYITFINIPTKGREDKINDMFFNTIKSNKGITIYSTTKNYDNCTITSASNTKLTFLYNNTYISLDYNLISAINIEKINDLKGGKYKKSRKNKKSVKSKKQNNKKSRKQRK